MKKAILVLLALVAVSACQPKNFDIQLPTGGKVNVLFYPGASHSDVDDLLIINKKNHFGKASYSQNDVLGDISFRLKNKQRVRAECTNSVVKYGQEKCAEYEVYRSDFPLIPTGSIIHLDK